MDGYGNWSIITQNTTSVFYNEQTLNVSLLPGSSTKTLSYYAKNAGQSDPPRYTVDVTDPTNLFLDSTIFSGTGRWYWGRGDLANATPAFYLEDPFIYLQIRDLTGDPGRGLLVNNGVVMGGDHLTFVINSNLYSVPYQRNYPYGSGGNSAIGSNQPWYANGDKGFVNIRVTTPQGATLDRLMSGSTQTQCTAVSTFNQNPNSSFWYWGGEPQSGGTTVNWNTGCRNPDGSYVYPSGTYTVIAEVRLDGMKENSKMEDGSDYTGKTVTEVVPVKIVQDTLHVEVNKESVIRGEQFAAIVTGKPNSYYFLWIRNIGSFVGNPLGNPLNGSQYGTTPPTINTYQDGVYLVTQNDFAGTPTGSYAVGYDPVGNYTSEYKVQIASEQPGGTGSLNGTYYRAIVKTDDSGQQTIAFSTTRLTKDQVYTIRVESDYERAGSYYNANTGSSFSTIGAPYYNGSLVSVTGSGLTAGYEYSYSPIASTNLKSDEDAILVKKEPVTIAAFGGTSFYLGDEIKLYGTNTESGATYLLITGPNVGGSVGARLDDPSRITRTGELTSFTNVTVLADHTWSYTWRTQNLPLDAGTYTIFAVSEPASIPDVRNASYGTLSLSVNKPYVRAAAIPPIVARGDSFVINGTALGNPPQGVQIWMMGKNYVGPATVNTTGTSLGIPQIVPINTDGTFSYELKEPVTKQLSPGSYYIVVQHPMFNTQFDIRMSTRDGQDTEYRGAVYSIISTKTSPDGIPQYYPSIFYMKGSGFSREGALQGPEAAEALIQAIGSADIDDTYTKLDVLIEEPDIEIDPIPDLMTGDAYEISGITNLAEGDNLLVQITSSTFKPTRKTQAGDFSGAEGVVQVYSWYDGMNVWYYDLNTTGFKPDEYLVQVSAIEQDATGSILFNVLDGNADRSPGDYTVNGTPGKVQTPAANTPYGKAPAGPTAFSPPGVSILIFAVVAAAAILILRRS